MVMIKYLFVGCSLLALGGCEMLSGLTERAAGINDEALLSAEFTICNAASVGSIQRRYNTTELKEARKVLCDKNNEVLP